MSDEFEYLGAPLDVVQALMDRAWDDDVDDDTRWLPRRLSTRLTDAASWPTSSNARRPGCERKRHRPHLPWNDSPRRDVRGWYFSWNTSQKGHET